MKIGIVGDAKRAVAWEQHLRPHRIVQEVDLCPSLSEIGSVDACIIIDDTDQNLTILYEAIRMELNCFLVSKPPENKLELEKIHHAAVEAGVHVQFSHWPTLAPATQWMMNRIKKPAVISITRDLIFTQWMGSETEYRYIWYDELGLCVKWINSGIHQMEAKEIQLENKLPIFMHLFLRFDNGATADIKINTGASENRHQRIISNKQEILDCNVREQNIRIGRLNSDEQLYFEKQSFDPARSAEKAALMFLKAIQMNAESPYTSFDAYQFAVQLERVTQRLRQFV